MSLNESAFGRILATPSGWFSRLLRPWDRVAKPGTASLIPSTNPRLMIKPVRPHHIATATLGDDSSNAPVLDTHYADCHHPTSAPKRQRVEENFEPGLTVIAVPANLRPMEFELELAYSMAIRELAARPDHLARPKRTLHGDLIEGITALRYRPNSMYLLADSRQPRTRLVEAGRPSLSTIASEPTHSSPPAAPTHTPRVFAVPSATASERSAARAASLPMTPLMLNRFLDSGDTPCYSSPLAGPIHVPGNDMFRDTRHNTAVNKLARLVDTKCGGAATKVSTELEHGRCIVRIKLPAQYLDYMPRASAAAVAAPGSDTNSLNALGDNPLGVCGFSPLQSSVIHDATLTVSDFSPLAKVASPAFVDDSTLVVSDFSPVGSDVSRLHDQPQDLPALLPQDVVEVSFTTQPQSQAIDTALPQEVVDAIFTDVQPQSQAADYELPQEVVEASSIITQPQSQATEAALPYEMVDALSTDGQPQSQADSELPQDGASYITEPLSQAVKTALPQQVVDAIFTDVQPQAADPELPKDEASFTTQPQSQAVESQLPQKVVEAPSVPIIADIQPQSQAIKTALPQHMVDAISTDGQPQSQAVESSTHLPQDVVEALFTPIIADVQPQSQAADSELPQDVVEAPSTPIIADVQPRSQAVTTSTQLPHMAVEISALDSPGREYLRAFISKSKHGLMRRPLGEMSPNASPSPPKRKLEDKPQQEKENGRDAKKARTVRAPPATPSAPPARRSARARTQPKDAASAKSAIPTPIKTGKAPTLSTMRTEQAELVRLTNANTRKNRGKLEAVEVVQARYLEAEAMSTASESEESERSSAPGVVWKEPLEHFAPVAKATKAAKKPATPRPKKATKVAAPAARPGTPRMTRSRTRLQKA